MSELTHMLLRTNFRCAVRISSSTATATRNDSNGTGWEWIGKDAERGSVRQLNVNGPTASSFQGSVGTCGFLSLFSCRH